MSPELLAINRSQAVIEFGLNGKILDANDNFLQVMGYRLADVIGQHHSMFMHPAEARSADYANFWKRLGKGEYFVAEFHRFGQGGREVWIQGSYNPILGPDGKPFKVMKLANDITQTKLKSSDADGQLTAIGNTQAVITFSLEGHIISANGLFCKTMGYDEAEIVGKHHRMFVHSGERQSAEYRSFWASLRQGVCQAGAFCRVDRNGRSVWLQASYTPILDPAGRPFKVVKFASDITAAKLRSLQFDAKLTVIGASAAVAEWDVDGRCLDCNKFLAGRPLLDLSLLLTKDDIDEVVRGRQVRREITWPGHEGSEAIWLDATFSSMADLEGRSDRILMCAVDVTPRRRTIAMTSTAMQGMLEHMTTTVGSLERIARTTNMLALNAGVQAAHAGEAGKGFGVVANEVRVLADQSEKAVEQISDLIAGGRTELARLEEMGASNGSAAIA